MEMFGSFALPVSAINAADRRKTERERKRGMQALVAEPYEIRDSIERSWG